ncbi:MAG: YvcK family protein [Chloroflexi bacterium]|nr:YvcK family protein [Chloroflexota bacterium]
MNRHLTTVWRWIGPGTHVKRWLALLLLAVAVAGLGIGLLLADAYKSSDFRWPFWAYYVTLQFINRGVRGLLLVTTGIGLTVGAFMGLNRSLVGLLVPEYRGNVAHLVHSRRILARGPRITCIGGGTGLSTLLRGLKEQTTNIAALVTVADEGSSSGILRRSMAVPPPGDARQCITALADAELLAAQVLEYRFDSRTPGLAGHSVGNLLLAAMTDVTGSFERALAEVSRILAVRGRILPATLTDVRLFAETVDGDVLMGEAIIDHHRGPALARIWMEPSHPRAFDEAIRAIVDADLVLVGPGSLYTSILPNLLIPEIVSALQATRAPRLYICNVATEPGATDGYSVADHVEAIERHVGTKVFDAVLVQEGNAPSLKPEWGVSRPRVERDRLAGLGYQVLSGELVSQERPTRHDSGLLAAIILRSIPTLRAQRARTPVPVVFEEQSSLQV